MTGTISALLTASSTKTSGSSATFIIFLVLIALVGYFLLIRPQKQRQRRQREQQSAIAVGDEIVTVGGIVGRVIAIDADRVTILSGGDTVGFPAVGNEPTRLVMVRNAVARKIEPIDPMPPPDPADRDIDEDETEHDRSLNGHLDGHGDTPLSGGSPDGIESESEGTSP